MVSLIYLDSCVLYETCIGPQCISVGSTNLPYGYKPLHFYQGEVSCITLTGKLDTIRLESHFYPDNQDLVDSEVQL